MTTQDVTMLALPYVRHCVQGARPEIAKAVGRLGWMALWPVWALVTGPALRVLVRLGIELAIGLTAPALLPLFEALDRLAIDWAGKHLPDDGRNVLAGILALLRTGRASMLDPVQATLALPSGTLGPDDAN